MKYAVIANGGKQYKVTEGQVLELDRIQAENGAEVKLDKVLLSVDGDSINIGAPYLTDMVVTAKVVDQTKGEKIRVSKFKAKAKYRRTTGFRAHLTKVTIGSIGTNAKKAAKAEQKA